MKALDEQLKTLRPEYYAQLQPGLSNEQIQALQEKHNITLPEDLIELYKWKNGQQNDCYEAFVNNSMFIPLESALETAVDNTEMIGLDFEIENWWHKDWIPVFNNGGGDLICYDMGGIFTNNPGQLIEFWHEDNDRNIIAPSLITFLEALITYYKAGQSDEYYQVEIPEGYPLRYIVE
jgi:cell wall assembly regulator SMI1